MSMASRPKSLPWPWQIFLPGIAMAMASFAMAMANPSGDWPCSWQPLGLI